MMLMLAILIFPINLVIFKRSFTSETVDPRNLPQFSFRHNAGGDKKTKFLGGLF